MPDEDFMIISEYELRSGLAPLDQPDPPCERCGRKLDTKTEKARARETIYACDTCWATLNNSNRRS